MDFPTLVKYTREKLGMSQEEMAHALKVSFATISRWENGKTRPNKLTQNVFYDFCRNQEMDTKYLIGEEHKNGDK